MFFKCINKKNSSIRCGYRSSIRVSLSIGPLVGPLVHWSDSQLVRNVSVKIAKFVAKSSFSEVSIASVKEVMFVHPLFYPSVGLSIYRSVHPSPITL